MLHNFKLWLNVVFEVIEFMQSLDELVIDIIEFE